MMKAATMAFIMLVFGFFGAVSGQELTLLGSYDLARPATEVVVDGDYAYLPDADSGLIVLDVSDPENPFLVGQGPPETRVEHITLFGNFIYGIREFYHYPPDSTRFKIIDVTNPELPVVVSTLTVVGHILDLEATDDYVYALNSYGNNMNIIDVSDPHNPYLANSVHVTGLISRLQIVESTVYVITLTHGLRIISIADPSNPVQIGYCYTPGMSYDLFVKGSYAYVTDISDLTVIDISVPSSPYVLQDTFQVFTSGRITANDHYVFLGIDRDSLGEEFVAIDIQNPADPRIASRYSMPEPVYMGKPVVANNCVYLPQYAGNYQLLIFDAAITGIDDNLNEPRFMGTLQNYPNPFNANTNIEFALSKQSYVSVTIYNILGQEVETLYEGIKQPGAHTLSWDAGAYPSGVYFARMEAGNYSKNIKMLLLR